MCKLRSTEKQMLKRAKYIVKINGYLEYVVSIAEAIRLCEEEGYKVGYRVSGGKEEGYPRLVWVEK